MLGSTHVIVPHFGGAGWIARGMPTSALVLALGAAFLHAFWNLILARAPDIESATAVALVAGVVAFAPVTVLAWDAEREVVPFLVVTSCLQLLYFVLLAAAYGRAELSFVYPIARGSAPVLVLLVSLVVLGDSASATEIGGVFLVAAGVLLVRGIGGHARASDLALALAVAGCIAAYTLIDKRGIEYASPIVYQELSMILPAAGFLALTLARRGRPAVRGAIGPPAIVAGLFAFGAYILVLAALSRAPAAPVAAVRETSVVIATALAAPLLHERVGAARLAGAAVVVLGVFLLSI
jgi:drug/metabolite transporter (DMT)-like permease